VGIGVGAGVFALLCAAATWWFLIVRRRRSKRKVAPEDVDPRRSPNRFNKSRVHVSRGRFSNRDEGEEVVEAKEERGRSPKFQRNRDSLLKSLDASYDEPRPRDFNRGENEEEEELEEEVKKTWSMSSVPKQKLRRKISAPPALPALGPFIQSSGRSRGRESRGLYLGPTLGKNQWRGEEGDEWERMDSEPAAVMTDASHEFEDTAAAATAISNPRLNRRQNPNGKRASSQAAGTSLGAPTRPTHPLPPLGVMRKQPLPVRRNNVVDEDEEIDASVLEVRAGVIRSAALLQLNKSNAKAELAAKTTSRPFAGAGRIAIKNTGGGRKKNQLSAGPFVPTLSKAAAPQKRF